MPDHDSTADAPNPTATGAGVTARTLVQTGGVPAADLPAVPGYELREELGKGGMGVVYKAQDTALNRSVAVKFLRPEYPSDGPAVQRFLDEAQICAQLQHPGIPPVHQVGALPDGRPFLVMKLIRGRTLDAELAARPSPADDRGRFVAAFEQVCQAVAFAHERGVIHRDLKPQNVMVGAFGEVQVMDWGLAKVVGAAEASPGADVGTAVRSVRELGTETQAGSVLGSPAYMPPEQAGGEVAKIDARTDVFGLGAVLCVVLTGQPPYTGADVNELHLKAIRGQTGDALARLDRCGAEPELVGLCKWCLAADPAIRPAHAGVVAGVVASVRADAERRARRAELDRVRAEGELEADRLREAEQRTKRRARATLAAMAATLVLAAVGLAWWVDRRRTDARTDEELRAAYARAAEDRKRAETEREVTAALAEVGALCDRGDRETENPPQWWLTLAASRSAQRRAAAALDGGVPTDALRAAVAAAAARISKDEFDCETAELYELWVLDLIGSLSGRSREKGRAEIRQATDRFFARLGIDLATATPDAVADVISQSRLRPRLVALLLFGDLASSGRGRPDLASLVASVAQVPEVIKQADDDGQIVAYLRDRGRWLTSSELTCFAVVDVASRDKPFRHVTVLCDEAILRNPANMLALLLRGGTRITTKFYAVGRVASLPEPPSPRERTDVERGPTGHHSRWLMAISNALALRPDLGPLWGWGADAAAKGGEYELAADWYRRALVIGSERHEFRSGLADSLMNCGQVAAALPEYRKAFADTADADQLPAALANAARCAAYLATEHPEGNELGPEQRRALRLEAMGWVRRWMRAALRSGLEVFILRHDPAFAGVRDPQFLDALPPDEMARWMNLWEDLRTMKTEGDQEFVIAGRFDGGSVGPQPAPPPRAK
jgi:tRNA A-37 threonylcarbamoyl transferase component Bud32